MAKIDAVVRRCLYTAYALVCSGLFWTSLNAQICPGMACNNQLQISVQQDCNIAFNADLLLEGAEALQGSQFYLTLNELGVNSVPIPMTGSGTFVVPSPFPFGTFSYLLENDCGNSCWGNIIVEDNLPPIADSCPCAVGSGDCELSCLEEPWIVNSSSFTEDLGWNPTFTDNCGDLGSILFNDIIVDGASCGSRSLTRTWTSTYTSHGVTITEILCVQEFTLDPIEINDIICPINLTALNPLGDFSLDCQIDSHPDSIAAFFDDPDTPVNEGMPYAYPHIMDGSKFSAIKALSCNIGVSFEDQILPLCGSGSFASKRILRTWTILDWCTSEASFCIQTLEFTDKEGPTVYELPTSINASTQPWLCAANINLPIPQFDDVCGIVTSVGYVLKENNIEVSSGSGFSISSLAVGNYDLYYVATDDCGNTSEFGPIPVTVLDDAPPVAVSDDQIVISLTGSATDGNGVAKLFANSVDNGSYDICGPIHFEIRRDEDLDCQFAGNTTYTTELVPVLDEDGNEVLDADGEVVMENVDTLMVMAYLVLLEIIIICLGL